VPIADSLHSCDLGAVHEGELFIGKQRLAMFGHNLLNQQTGKTITNSVSPPQRLRPSPYRLAEDPVETGEHDLWGVTFAPRTLREHNV
jgi:hypothetical protein